MLVYRVDVKYLSEYHCRSVLALVNSCFDSRINNLEYSYGVICQDHGNVLGVAFVNVNNGTHHIERLCVDRSRRGEGIGTDMIAVVKEQIGLEKATLSLPGICPRREDVIAFFQTNGFTQPKEGKMEYMP